VPARPRRARPPSNSQGRREPPSRLRRSRAEIDRADLRQAAAPNVRAGRAAYFSALGVVRGGLEGGRREASTTGAALDAARAPRHVAGVVTDPRLLLVGGLVLLVDDDRAQASGRAGTRAERAPGHHRGLPGRNRGVELSRRRAPMPNARQPGARRSAPQTVAGTARSAPISGQQDQGLHALADRFRDGLEIDLRLAGAVTTLEAGSPRRPPSPTVRSEGGGRGPRCGVREATAA
jgi:hypothetical protein